MSDGLERQTVAIYPQRSLIKAFLSSMLLINMLLKCTPLKPKIVILKSHSMKEFQSMS